MVVCSLSRALISTPTAPPLISSSDQRIVALDGVRGLAILLVTFYRFSKDTQLIGELPGGLGLLFSFGIYGVDLFFVLSGFLITSVLIKTRDDERYFSRFFIRRSFRIFPLYFGSLLLFLVVLPRIFEWGRIFEPARHQSWNLWTYTSNLKMSLEGEWTFGCLDHFWSLAVEEHFYLVWPFVVWYFGRHLIRLTIIGLLLAASSRVIFCAWSDNQVAPEAFTLFRCDGLLLGALVALTADRVTPVLSRLQRWCLPLGLAGILIALAACILEKRLLTIPQIGITLAWAALLLLIVRRPEWPVRRFFGNRVLTSLGKYSYAIYIFQSPLIPMARPAWEASAAKVAAHYPLTCDVLYLIFMSALSYSLAVVSWYVLEKPMLQLRDRLTSSEPALPQSKLAQAATSQA